MRASSRLNAKFLYYFLQANVGLLNDLGTGTTFKDRVVQFSSFAENFESETKIKSGTPSFVADVFTSPRPDQIVGEGAQAGGDVGVLADAGRILGEGGVAHVVTAILYAPMRANPLIPTLGRLVGGRRHPEDDLVRVIPKSRRRVALEDRALQPEHGLDQRLPGRMAKPGLGRNDGQLAGFPAIAAFALGRIRANRLHFVRGGGPTPSAQVKPLQQRFSNKCTVTVTLVLRGHESAIDFWAERLCQK